MGVPATIYLIVIAGLGVWAVVDDLREGQSRLRVFADVLVISRTSFGRVPEP